MRMPGKPQAAERAAPAEDSVAHHGSAQISVAAIEQGFMQDEIARSAYEYQSKIESGERIN